MSRAESDPLEIAVRSLDARFERDPGAPRLRIVGSEDGRTVEVFDRRTGETFRRVPPAELLELHARVQALEAELRDAA